jgi:hypothetical protein
MKKNKSKFLRSFMNQVGLGLQEKIVIHLMFDSILVRVRFVR